MLIEAGGGRKIGGRERKREDDGAMIWDILDGFTQSAFIRHIGRNIAILNRWKHDTNTKRERESSPFSFPTFKPCHWPDKASPVRNRLLESLRVYFVFRQAFDPSTSLQQHGERCLRRAAADF